MPPERAEGQAKDSALGRAGQSAEVAPADVVFASRESSYITAEMLGVTGGRPVTSTFARAVLGRERGGRVSGVADVSFGVPSSPGRRPGRRPCPARCPSGDLPIGPSVPCPPTLARRPPG